MIQATSQLRVDKQLIVHRVDHGLVAPPGYSFFSNIDNPDYQLCEVGAFFRYFRAADGIIQWPDEYTHVTLVSPKIFAKTGLAPAEIDALIDRHLPHVDALLFNPFPQLKECAANIWERGNRKHPGFMDLTRYTPLDRDQLMSAFYGGRYSTYCNYVVGNRRFWERYIAFVWPIADGLMRAWRAGEIENRYFHHALPLSDIPYFIERCMAEFLRRNDGNLTFHKIDRGSEFHASQVLVKPLDAVRRHFPTASVALQTYLHRNAADRARQRSERRAARNAK